MLEIVAVNLSCIILGMIVNSILPLNLELTIYSINDDVIVMNQKKKLRCTCAIILRLNIHVTSLIVTCVVTLLAREDA